MSNFDEGQFFRCSPTLMKIKSTKQTLKVLSTIETPYFSGGIDYSGRDKSVKLIKELYKGNKTIGVVSQKNADIENPTLNDLNSVGTMAHIMKMLRMPDGNITVIIQGRKLIQLNEITQSEPYLKASVNELVRRSSKSR